MITFMTACTPQAHPRAAYTPAAPTNKTPPTEGKRFGEAQEPRSDTTAVSIRMRVLSGPWTGWTGRTGAAGPPVSPARCRRRDGPSKAPCSCVMPLAVARTVRSAARQIPVRRPGPVTRSLRGPVAGDCLTKRPPNRGRHKQARIGVTPRWSPNPTTCGFCGPHRAASAAHRPERRVLPRHATSMRPLAPRAPSASPHAPAAGAPSTARMLAACCTIGPWPSFTAGAVSMRRGSQCAGGRTHSTRTIRMPSRVRQGSCAGRGRARQQRAAGQQHSRLQSIVHAQAAATGCAPRWTCARQADARPGARAAHAQRAPPCRPPHSPASPRTQRATGATRTGPGVVSSHEASSAAAAIAAFTLPYSLM